MKNQSKIYSIMLFIITIMIIASTTGCKKTTTDSAMLSHVKTHDVIFVDVPFIVKNKVRVGDTVIIKNVKDITHEIQYDQFYGFKGKNDHLVNDSTYFYCATFNYYIIKHLDTNYVKH